MVYWARLFYHLELWVFRVAPLSLCMFSEDPKTRLHSRVFPKMMSRNAPTKFSYKSSSFRVQRSKVTCRFQHVGDIHPRSIPLSFFLSLSLPLLSLPLSPSSLSLSSLSLSPSPLSLSLSSLSLPLLSLSFFIGLLKYGCSVPIRKTDELIYPIFLHSGSHTHIIWEHVHMQYVAGGNWSCVHVERNGHHK